jgi:signal transduction histidine kinase
VAHGSGSAEKNVIHPVDQGQKIPKEISTQLRTLAHDLSNSIETIMQACYLLNQSQLDETSKRWAAMIDTGARDAARINRDIRDILRSKST